MIDGKMNKKIDGQSSYFYNDRLEYKCTIEYFDTKYDLPDNMIDVAREYEALKMKHYATLTDAEKNEMHNLATQLYDYCITANDFNKLFRVNNDLQHFMKYDVVDYINGLLKDMADMANTTIDVYNTLIQKFHDWWDAIKNNIVATIAPDFDNWLLYEHVDRVTTTITDGHVLETLMFLNNVIAWRETTITESGNQLISTERIVYYADDYQTRIWDKTRTTTIVDDNTSTITENIVNNI